MYYLITILCLLSFGNEDLMSSDAIPSNHFDITNTVHNMLDPLYKRFGRFYNGNETDKQLIIKEAEDFVSGLDIALGKACAEGNPRAQFYYGQGLRYASVCCKSITNTFDKYNTNAYMMFKMSAEKGHPGSAEMMARYSNGEAQINWRYQAMEFGCITSFRQINKDIRMLDDGEINGFRTIDDLYTYAYLQMLCEAKLFKRIDHNEILWSKLDLLVKLQIKSKYGDNAALVTSKCESKAVAMFNVINNNYMLKEILIDLW